MLNGFFEKILGKNKSKDVAKKRLQFALIYDQMEVSEDILDSLQRDVVAVISRYFVIDEDAIKLDIQREKNVSALIVNTPIIRAMRKQPGSA
ncbi:MAG: cell division topological specificity factor MinE [Desulfobacterales bacterium]|jgi:cell division topological specificity factor|nr:cell division topological specificity factor MinE [Desulfobacterales bacterium]